MLRTVNGNVRFHLSPFRLFDGNLFSLMRGSIAICGTVSMKSKVRKTQTFSISFFSATNKLSPPHCTTHTHSFLPWEENFYQYLTFHFRTNDFIIIFFLPALFLPVFGVKFFLTVCYLQAERNRECAKNTAKSRVEKREKTETFGSKVMFNITLIDDSKEINNKLNSFPSHFVQTIILNSLTWPS